MTIQDIFALAKILELFHHKHYFFSGEHLGTYYCLYNTNAEFEYIAVEECKLFGINKIEFLKLLKDYPEIEQQIREIQYTTYESIKNRMEKGILKEINELNKKNNLDKIKYISNPMVKAEENKNGMTINNFLKKKIKQKENEINKLNKILKEKYELGNNKLNEFKTNYNKFIKKYNEEKYGFNLSPFNYSQINFTNLKEKKNEIKNY